MEKNTFRLNHFKPDFTKLLKTNPGLLFTGTIFSYYKFAYPNKVLSFPFGALIGQVNGVEPLKQGVVQTKMHVGFLLNSSR
jgi:hypothetical protein